ncbi:LacI family DNA-binding transcriptional regulator [Myceligenerans pegani]|uniref:LacI family DNA-binding transcriptional regulator n=1 Tax=Myceligenerans pegani TaxID=2776917 RepID=A0ABR9N0W0_9MICO|nr:LacI family DNA-binding transcriptional regulator [Myceligenerans sp. TRM 65318]MBE1877292.1 LacI family DNA-binding transcriptional regulator [Myceligenerans sp. TRM 65318]MBE3019563.1 LacI family DNA-binding transcriptional regulator [Myceligenerans sp. TRM 65318]
MTQASTPTLVTVAERAGVSRQTVSNVLNSPEIVRPDTRERVLRAIDELGYRTNVVARQLRTRRSFLLGLRMPPAADGISGQVLDRFLHALTEEAQGSGLRIMLFAAADDEAEIREYENLRTTTGIDGFVLTATHSGDTRTRWLSDHDIPFATFGRPWDPEPAGRAAEASAEGVPPKPGHHAWVDIDGRAGTRAATRHLLDAGHRRIAFLGWPEGSGVGDDRHAGWLAAYEEAGLEHAVVQRAEDGVAEGTAAANRALADPGVTALVCVSDSIALGALEAVRELARSEPDRAPVAITGFDDTPVAGAVGLTSVAQPIDQVAARIVEQLRAQIDGRPEDVPDHQVLIEPRLVVRTTSRTEHRR